MAAFLRMPLLLSAALLLLPACDLNSFRRTPLLSSNEFAKELNVNPDALTRTRSGLQHEDLAMGTGALAGAGSAVRVHYTGWLTDGSRFDTSADQGTPFGFRLGQGEVIAGWDEGIVGMRVGGRRKLVIPPELGYGAVRNGPIPPDATLVFDIELVGVE